MALPHTKDGNYKFITNEPDWVGDMVVRQSWQTGVLVHRDESEQRYRKQKNPKMFVDYALSDLDADDFSVRRAAILQELDKLLIVPIWPFEMPSPDTMATFQIDWSSYGGTEALYAAGFRVDGWVYLEESGLDSIFMRIASITNPSGTDSRIGLSSRGSDKFPNITIPTYTTDVIVRPCISGMRQQNSFSSQQKDIGFNDEFVSVEEL